MRQWEVWCEGYNCSGNSGKATLFGKMEAESFGEACRRVIKGNNYDEALFNEEQLTYWGCQLFDNEAEARKNFG